MEKGGRLSAARRAGGLDEREAETTRAIHLRTTDAHARRSLAGNLALGEGSAEAWAGPSGDEGRERKGRVSMGTLAIKRDPEISSDIPVISQSCVASSWPTEGSGRGPSKRAPESFEHRPPPQLETYAC